jgi:multiple sugar transport system ATP-binding protein
MAKVELKNVSRTFPDGTQAVSNVDLEVGHKESLVLVGPSGCGKSTTLRMIAGLEKVGEGEIYIDGKLVNDIRSRDRDVAMVFQNSALYPRMSVYDNMAFALRLRKLSKGEVDSRVNEASTILGINGLLNRKPGELSNAQKLQVAVGRAIARKPGVLLLDEVLGSLDATLKEHMMAEISRLHTRLQATMIFVTRSQSEAMTIGDKIAVMKDGIVQQADSSLNLYGKPANRFVAGFMGRPPMNFADGKIVKKGDHMYFREGRFDVKVEDEMVPHLSDYADQEVIFGIRPEDIYDRLLVGQSSPENTIKARVEVVNPAGSEVFLSFYTGLNRLTGRVDAHTQASVGQELEFVFDMAKVHFFDKDSEEAIV